ncbi:NADPH:quinone reductase-like Zn-dependent oxidoreductase [Pontibacter aydingkolensis]|uniref:NADP-dependent oxidoreductase n=1 Tax=Pontibacter aydingkolensis TaxID=1911536 RepID=A0ABS7CZ21_9BACT|nr:NADP-dependent oxidoreductase [Pontibacter aydingkolensis]MBW7469109.1 NADP-dependent oxidoreductase [Pontibacter aydingkolensis]
MKAYVVNEPGGIEKLQIQEIDKPTPKAGELLVKVKAISINPVDTKTREGKAFYNALAENPPVIIGWDISGVVEAVGEDVKVFKEGDEVFGMVNFPGQGRAYAEYVAAPEAHLAHKPANIPHHEAAAATLAALTAWQALVHQAGLKAGQRVLIHAAAGGVGHFAVQIASYFKATVIGTASPENHDFIRNMGAAEQIDYHQYDPAKVVMDADIVLDSLGEENTRKSLGALKDGGTIVSILGGAKEAVQEEAKKRSIAAKNYLVHSSAEDMEKIAELMRQGHLRPHVSHVYTFKDLPKAHQQVETRKTRGKVVVSLDE